MALEGLTSMLTSRADRMVRRSRSLARSQANDCLREFDGRAGNSTAVPVCRHA